MRFTTLFGLLLVSSFLLFSRADPLPICRGLVLQGGSDKGAYQAGALQGLLQKLGAEEISYDVISGVTIGSINAAWMSQFGKGMEEPMVDELADFWLTVKASDMYKNWAGGPVQGLLFESSLYNADPGMQYLKNHITKPPQRYVAIGAANANKGTYKVFNNFEKSLEAQPFLEAVMASNGIVGVFPYKNIDGSTYFDGSVLKSMDVASVIHQCKKLTGGDESKIVIDMIMLAGKNLPTADVTKFNALQVLIRTLEMMSYHDSLIGFIRAQQSFPKINFRHVIVPSSPIPSGNLPMSFNHKDIVKMMQLGKDDAIKAVAKGAGVTFREAVDHALKVTKRGGFAAESERASNDFYEQLSKIQKENRNSTEEVISI